MKNIDVNEATSWSDAELADNIAWLESRGNLTAIAKIKTLRSEGPTTTKASKPNFDDATVEEVLAWVGDDKKKAQTALDKENEFEKPRKTLVEPLEELLTS